MYNTLRPLSTTESDFVGKARVKIAELGTSISRSLSAGEVPYEETQLSVELEYVINALEDPTLEWTPEDIQMVIDYYTIEGNLEVIPFRDLDSWDYFTIDITTGTGGSAANTARIEALENEDAIIKRDIAILQAAKGITRVGLYTSQTRVIQPGTKSALRFLNSSGEYTSDYSEVVHIDVASLNHNGVNIKTSLSAVGAAETFEMIVTSVYDGNLYHSFFLDNFSTAQPDPNNFIRFGVSLNFSTGPITLGDDMVMSMQENNILNLSEAEAAVEDAKEYAEAAEGSKDAAQIAKDQADNAVSLAEDFKEQAEAAAGGAVEARNDTIEVYNSIVGEESAIQVQISNMNSTIENNAADIDTLQTTLTNGDEALALRMESLSATVDTNSATISTIEMAYAEGDAALAATIELLSVTVGGETIYISESKAVELGEESLGSVLTTIELNTELNEAKIDESTVIQEDNTGKINAIRSVTLDVNGYVSGTSSFNDGTRAEFTVTADAFRIANPNQPGGESPFEVVDGITYIKSAYIRTISIGDLADEVIDEVATRTLVVDTDASVIQYDSDGNLVSEPTITLTAEASGVKGVAYYQIIVNDVVIKNTKNPVFVYDVPTTKPDTDITIKTILREEIGDQSSLCSGVLASDLKTFLVLNEVKDGVDALSVTLSITSTVFQGDSFGTITDLEEGVTTVLAYRGIEELVYDQGGSSVNTYSLSIQESGIYGTIDEVEGRAVYTPVGNTSSAGNVRFVITDNATTESRLVIYTYSIAGQGAEGPAGPAAITLSLSSNTQVVVYDSHGINPDFEEVTLTATTQNAGEAPEYEFFLNGESVYVGTDNVYTHPIPPHYDRTSLSFEAKLLETPQDVEPRTYVTGDTFTVFKVQEEAENEILTKEGHYPWLSDELDGGEWIEIGETEDTVVRERALNPHHSKDIVVTTSSPSSPDTFAARYVNRVLQE